MTALRSHHRLPTRRQSIRTLLIPRIFTRPRPAVVEAS